MTPAGDRVRSEVGLEAETSVEAGGALGAAGPDVFEVLIENKTIEWDHYRAQVTSWELDTYLPIL